MDLNGYLNSNVYKIIQSDIQNGMLTHSYILYGYKADEVKELSVFMAQHILCQQENAPCGKCNVCHNIYKGIYSDVLVYPKNSKGLKVEDAKEIVNESLVVPFENNKKVYILNDFDLANVLSQNKLLNTIEEPASSVVFIINTSNINGVLSTIKSRSKKIYVTLDNTTTVKPAEQNNQQAVSNEVLDLLTNLAFSLFLQMKNSSQVLSYSFKIGEYEEHLPVLLNILQTILADATKLKYKIVNTLVNKNYVSQLTQIADTFSVQALKELFDDVSASNQMISTNCNKNAVIENFLIKILEVKFKCQKQ